MNSTEFCAIARRLMNHPAAPYHESGVAAEVNAICLEHDLNVRSDQWGNLIVTLKTAPKMRPIALAAHMDHPGFHIKKELGRGRWLAQFRGGVSDPYFVPGTRVRLMPGGDRAVIHGKLQPERKIELQQSGRRRAARKPLFAVWDLPEFEVKDDQISGRACDDLVGVAAVLATMIDLKRSKTKVHVLGLISRAEEVGFHGALALAATKQIPANALIVSLETSKELPPVKMGQGVIIRVGDRTSIFDSRATRYLTEIASDLHKEGRPFQRALMSGGTCEATAYQEFGFTTCAVCVALGNYHNCAPKNRIEAEFVSIADALSMVRLLTEAARQMGHFNEITDRLPKRLNTYVQEAKRGLIARKITRQNALRRG
jgi:putative aminopeptidase FrvX